MKRIFWSVFFGIALVSSVACNSDKTNNNSADSLAGKVDSTAGVSSQSLENQVEKVDSATEAGIDSLRQ